MHEYPLIMDLAIILVAAGCTSVICRALKLPILVGYLIAGVLTGPYFPLFPNMHDMASIHTWSEIGVIFLLFALGLEFNFKDLFKVGKTGLVSVLCISSGMMLACLGVGLAMGWSTVTSIFMGGIMSISSTMVIVKAFEEMKLKGEPFTHIVYGVMVFQDILGIILMVILPMIAASQNGSILQSISTTAMKVVFFLVLWFVGGIFLVPSLLRRLKQMLSDEILLIISLGLCLGMVMLADDANLSTALGAFTIGSILGTTSEAHRIETLVTPLKNLFGAVFFVSIGMLVNPSAIWNNIGLLILFFAMIVILNPIFGTLGAFLSGKSLKLSLKAGSCYGQIGEFSFILATLGVSTKVLNDDIYPVVIMVSAIAMVTTPYWIKLSDKLIVPVSKLLPKSKQDRLENDRQVAEKAPNRRLILIKQFISETFILSMICLGIVSLLDGFIEPNIREFILSHWPSLKQSVIDGWFVDGNTMPLGEFISLSIGLVLTLLALSPFLSALLMHRNKLNRTFLVLLVRGTGEMMFRVMQFIRILVVLFFLIMTMYVHSPFMDYVDVGIVILVFLLVSCFQFAFSGYIRMERQFLFNYNEADVDEEDTAESSDSLKSMSNIQAGEWLSSALSVASYRVDEDSPFLDKTLIELNLRAKHDLFIIRIDRSNEESINIPAGQESLQLDDTIHIAGSYSSLRALKSEPYHISDKKLHIQSMRQFSHQLQALRSDAANLRCIQMPIRESSGLAGKTLRTSGISGRNKCLVIGIEQDGRVSMNPKPDDTFVSGCRLWVVGESDMLTNLLAENV